MNGLMYPEKEILPTFSDITGTIGTPIDMSYYMQNVGSIFVRAPAGLTAAVTVTIETVEGDEAQSYCAPGTPWVPAQMGGVCDPLVVWSLVINPVGATATVLSPTGYSLTLGQTCRQPLQCRSRFIRAKLSAATPGLVVMMIGKPKSIYSL